MLHALWEKYASFLICSGDELFLPLSIASQFVSDCTTSELAVVGVEFFHRNGDEIIPVVDPLNGLDCSDALSGNVDWRKVVQQCNSTAISVLEYELERDSTQYANLTILSNDDIKRLKVDRPAHQ